MITSRVVDVVCTALYFLSPLGVEKSLYRLGRVTDFTTMSLRAAGVGLPFDLTSLLGLGSFDVGE